jgi:dUTP pyrophosphatase
MSQDTNRINLVCTNCKKSFKRLPKDIVGKTSFCSKKCFYTYLRKFPELYGRKKDITAWISLICEQCTKKFFRPRYEYKNRNSKHIFCSIECSNTYKEKNAIHLSDRRKRRLIENSTGCEICGGGFLLEIHHKDGNNKNNKIENLQVLCKKCHYHTHGRNFYVHVPQLKVKKNHPKAHLPTKKYVNDAGYDLYSVEDKLIKSKKIVEVNIGISIAFPFEIYGIIFTRSSFGKRGLQVHNGVIDNGFRGNITVFIYNLSDEDYQVKTGDRIAQLLIHKNRSFYEPTEIEVLPTSERGEKGFGSSGI